MMTPLAFGGGCRVAFINGKRSRGSGIQSLTRVARWDSRTGQARSRIAHSLDTGAGAPHRY